MPTYTVDVWGTTPTPETFQNIEAEDEDEAEAMARGWSEFRVVTNVEVVKT